MNSNTKNILPQASQKFTDFLAFECALCKSSVGKEKALKFKNAWACAECFQRLSDTAQQIVSESNDKPRKVVRLYHCFGCNENFAVQKMSSCLAICRNCFKATQNYDNRKLNQFLTKTLSKLGGFLRGKI